MLRIVTLNLNYRVAKHGAWAERRELIVRTLREAGADVVALQAVEEAEGTNQATELAQALGFEHVAFVAAERHENTHRGSAFIATVPLLDLAVRALSRTDDHDDKSARVVLRARVASDGLAFDLYNAHFSWVAPQALINVRETLAFRAAAPALLCGDLNSAPDSDAIAALRAAGWIDLWRALRVDDAGYTFEADRPSMRIDYALVTRELRPHARAIERIGVGMRALPRLSDHLGLLVTLGAGTASAV